jgi:hypothetical protein
MGCLIFTCPDIAVPVAFSVVVSFPGLCGLCKGGFWGFQAP